MNPPRSRNARMRRASVVTDERNDESILAHADDLHGVKCAQFVPCTPRRYKRQAADTA